MKTATVALLTVAAFAIGFLASLGINGAGHSDVRISAGPSLSQIDHRFDGIEDSIERLAARIDAKKTAASAQSSLPATGGVGAGELEHIVAGIRDEVRVALATLGTASDENHREQRDAELRGDAQARVDVEKAMGRIDGAIERGSWSSELDLGTVELAMSKMTSEEHAAVRHRLILAMERGELDPDGFDFPF